MVLSNIDAIVLDFDGTIVNSMPVQERAWNEAVVAVCGNDPQVNDIIRRNLYAGKAGEQMFDGLEVSGATRRALRSEKDSRWVSIQHETPLLEDAKAVLESLAVKFRLAIATTAKRSYVARVLDREGMGRLFSVVVTNEDLSAPKPDPEMLRATADHFSVPMLRILMIGDAESDARMARAAGCPFVHLASDGEVNKLRRYEPLHVTRDWTELGRYFSA